jgi:hypothetical protein
MGVEQTQATHIESSKFIQKFQPGTVYFENTSHPYSHLELQVRYKDLAVVPIEDYRQVARHSEYYGRCRCPCRSHMNGLGMSHMAELEEEEQNHLEGQ